jgi:hypothetical protein
MHGSAGEGTVTDRAEFRNDTWRINDGTTTFRPVGTRRPRRFHGSGR